MNKHRLLCTAGLLPAAAFVWAGCAGALVTNPPRSATEELLISTAADRAIASTVLTNFAHHKVFLDGSYYESYDAKYVLGALRDALSRSGALLVNTETNSEFVVEARSGALSIDNSDALFGIPSAGAPLPLAGALAIPEIALYKASHQRSIAKLALLAYATHSREHYYSSGPMVGKSYNNYYKVLLGIIQWTTTDIPEKKRPKKQKND